MSNAVILIKSVPLSHDLEQFIENELKELGSAAPTGARIEFELTQNNSEFTGRITILSEQLRLFANAIGESVIETILSLINEMKGQLIFWKHSRRFDYLHI